MESMPWILLGVLVLLILFAVVAVVLKRKKKTPPDYYAFFIMGIIWLAAGIPLGNYGLSAMGLVLTIVGLANKDKWKENRRTWSHLDKEERRPRNHSHHHTGHSGRFRICGLHRGKERNHLISIVHLTICPPGPFWQTSGICPQP